MSKFLSFLFFLISFVSFGQQKVLKNELDISVVKISTVPFDFYNSNFSRSPNTGAHIIYKYRIYEKFYFRGSQSFYQYSINDDFYSGYNSQRNIKEINTSAGLEFRYFKTKREKLRLYSGLDFTTFFNRYKYYSYGRFTSSSPSDINHTQRGIGVQGFTGLSICPIKELVFTLETSLLGGVGKEKLKYQEDIGFVQPETEDRGLQPFAQFFLLRTASIGWVF